MGEVRRAVGNGGLQQDVLGHVAVGEDHGEGEGVVRLGIVVAFNDLFDGHVVGVVLVGQNIFGVIAAGAAIHKAGGLHGNVCLVGIRDVLVVVEAGEAVNVPFSRGAAVSKGIGGLDVHVDITHMAAGGLGDAGIVIGKSVREALGDLIAVNAGAGENDAAEIDGDVLHVLFTVCAGVQLVGRGERQGARSGVSAVDFDASNDARLGRRSNAA